MKRSETDMNDLEFIRKHVKTWPEGATSVRLDRDGEICFNGYDVVDHDFYPDGYDASIFNGCDGVGVKYSRTQWLPEQDLTTLDVPFGELDRDTQLRLVNHRLDGGDVNLRAVDGDWITVPFIKGDVIFVSHHKYRAVAKQPEQPTERETLEAKLHEQWVEFNATMKRITEIK